MAGKLADFERASEVIRKGGVIAFRTDTFYGLGADPFNRTAVARIRKLKGREGTKPILLLISDAREIGRFITSPSNLFQAAAEKFWPGPITLVGLARPELTEELTSGTKTIGVRLPNDKEVQGLVRACGGALTATSANPSGRKPARSAEEVRSYFSERLDLIVDGGAVTAVMASTVLDLSSNEPRLIREGQITRGQLQQALGLDLGVRWQA
jgi:L-threonylcarbamoyladenylate synthase